MLKSGLARILGCKDLIITDMVLEPDSLSQFEEALIPEGLRRKALRRD